MGRLCALIHHSEVSVSPYFLTLFMPYLFAPSQSELPGIAVADTPGETAMTWTACHGVISLHRQRPVPSRARAA